MGRGRKARLWKMFRVGCENDKWKRFIALKAAQYRPLTHKHGINVEREERQYEIIIT